MTKKTLKGYQNPLTEVLGYQPDWSILTISSAGAPENFDNQDTDVNDLFQ